MPDLPPPPPPPNSVMELVDSLPLNAPLPGFMTVFPFVEMDLNLIIEAYEKGCLDLGTEEALTAANYGEVKKSRAATGTMVDATQSYGGTRSSTVTAKGGENDPTATATATDTKDNRGVMASAEAGVQIPDGGEFGVSVGAAAGPGGVGVGFEIDPPGLGDLPDITLKDGTVIPNPFAMCFPCDNRITFCLGMLPVPSFISLFDELIYAIMEFIRKMKELFNKENFYADMCLLIDALRFVCPQDLALMLGTIRFKVIDIIRRLISINITWLMIVGLLVLPLFILTSMTFDVIASLGLGPLKCLIQYLSDFSNMAHGIKTDVEEFKAFGARYKQSMQKAKDAFDKESAAGLGSLLPSQEELQSYVPANPASAFTGDPSWPTPPPPPELPVIDRTGQSQTGGLQDEADEIRAEVAAREERQRLDAIRRSHIDQISTDEAPLFGVEGEDVNLLTEDYVSGDPSASERIFREKQIAAAKERAEEDAAQDYNGALERRNRSMQEQRDIMQRQEAMSAAMDEEARRPGSTPQSVEAAGVEANQQTANDQEEDKKKPKIPMPPPAGALKKFDKFIGQLSAFETMACQLTSIFEIIEAFQDAWYKAAKGCVDGWTKLITQKLDAVLELAQLVRLVALLVAVIEALATDSLNCDPSEPLTPDDIQSVVDNMPDFQPGSGGGPPLMESEIIDGTLIIKDRVANKTFTIPTCVGTMPNDVKDEVAQWIKDLEGISI